jgi:hypothetical protein
MKNVRNSLAVSFLINVLWKDKPCEVGNGSLFSSVLSFFIPRCRLEKTIKYMHLYFYRKRKRIHIFMFTNIHQEIQFIDKSKTSHFFSQLYENRLIPFLLYLGILCDISL